MARTNRLPWRKVVSSYPVEIEFGDDGRTRVTFMLVLACGHRRKGTPGQTRAGCKRCRSFPSPRDTGKIEE